MSYVDLYAHCTAKTPAAKRTIGQLIKRLLLLDLFKGLMVTFRYNARALYEPRDGGGSVFTLRVPAIDVPDAAAS